MPSILITKALQDVPLLEAFCLAQSVDLTAESYIRFEAIAAEIPDRMEAIFFGSPRAVDFFLAQGKVPEGCEIACIGKTTENYLLGKGFTVGFSGGSGAGDPEKVAERLREWLGGRKLHIARSEQSRRTIAGALPASQVEEMIVYRTITMSACTDCNPDVLVFTSPSNLEGFLKSNLIQPDTALIAWGKTTEKALNRLGHRATHVLSSASEQELVSYLSSTLGILK